MLWSQGFRKPYMLGASSHQDGSFDGLAKFERYVALPRSHDCVWMFMHLSRKTTLCVIV